MTMSLGLCRSAQARSCDRAASGEIAGSSGSTSAAESARAA
jgi:hypothetical protein